MHLASFSDMIHARTHPRMQKCRPITSGTLARLELEGVRGLGMGFSREQWAGWAVAARISRLVWRRGSGSVDAVPGLRVGLASPIIVIVMVDCAGTILIKIVVWLLTSGEAVRW